MLKLLTTVKTDCERCAWNIFLMLKIEAVDIPDYVAQVKRIFVLCPNCALESPLISLPAALGVAAGFAGRMDEPNRHSERLGHHER